MSNYILNISSTLAFFFIWHSSVETVNPVWRNARNIDGRNWRHANVLFIYYADVQCAKWNVLELSQWLDSLQHFAVSRCQLTWSLSLFVIKSVPDCMWLNLCVSIDNMQDSSVNYCTSSLNTSAFSVSIRSIPNFVTSPFCNKSSTAAILPA